MFEGLSLEEVMDRSTWTMRLCITVGLCL